MNNNIVSTQMWAGSLFICSNPISETHQIAEIVFIFYIGHSFCNYQAFSFATNFDRLFRRQ